jgi:hypothetical protein
MGSFSFVNHSGCIYATHEEPPGPHELNVMTERKTRVGSEKL